MKKLFFIATVLVLAVTIAFTCGDYGYYDRPVTFVKEDLISDPSLPFFVGYETGWYHSYREENEMVDANLVSWRDYLETADLPLKDLGVIVYSINREQLQAILAGENKLPGSINNRKDVKNNAVLKIWASNKKITQEMGDYLLFAKACEVEAERERWSWRRPEGRDTAKMFELIANAKQKYKSEKNKFIKRRYAFQALRLAFLLGSNQQCLALFKKYFKKGPKDYIYYRALETKAGVLHRQDDPEATYLFARVFVNCPDRRQSCVNSFYFSNSANWDKAISYCKTKEETAAFYTMRALQNGANIAEEMENIAAVDPASSGLELLYMRVIYKAQSAFISTDLQQRNPESTFEHYNIQRITDLCHQLRQNESLPNQDFWQVAAAYTELFMRNFEQTQEILSQVNTASKYYKQAKLLRFVTKVGSLKEVDMPVLDSLLLVLQEDENLSGDKEVVDYFENACTQRFLKEGDKARAYLIKNKLANIKSYLDIDIIVALEEFIISGGNKGAFDEFLIKERIGGLDNLSLAYEMEGLYFLQRHQLKEAIAAFEKCSEKYQKENASFNSAYLDKNIWTSYIFLHTHRGEVKDSRLSKYYEQYTFLNKKYNILSFAKQLQDLEERAVSNPEKAAEYYYLIGIALMNLSPYGRNHPIYYDKWDSYSYIELYNGIGNRSRSAVLSYYDEKIALGYFDKVVALTTNPELKTKAIYMKATIRELEGGWWDEGSKEKIAYQACFKQLKEECSNTAYYQEIIKECYYFKEYLEK